MSSYSSSGKKGYRKSHRGGSYYKREGLLTKILKLVLGGGKNDGYRSHGNNHYNNHNSHNNYHRYNSSHSYSKKHGYKSSYSSSWS